MSGRLQGKTALVTGGGQGIGRGMSEGFAREGARVAVNYLDLPEVRKAAEAVAGAIRAKGGEAFAVEGDLGDEASIARMVERVSAEFGPVDLLVNNAGVMSSLPVLEIEPSELRRILEINVVGLFTVSRIVARQMVTRGTGGAIVNISSLAADRPFLFCAHYNASKSAVTALTRSMAMELGQYGIRVNELCPASVQTGMTSKPMQDPANVEMRKRTIPLGRIGKPEDLAGAAIFLCSDEASWITGASILTDGGLSVIAPFGPPPRA